MRRLSTPVRHGLTLAALFGVSAAVYAAGADLGQADKQDRAPVIDGCGLVMVTVPITRPTCIVLLW